MRAPQLLLPVFALLALSSCTTKQDGVPVTYDVESPTPAPPAPRISTPEVTPKQSSRDIAEKASKPTNPSSSPSSNSSPPSSPTQESNQGQPQSSGKPSLEDRAKEFARTNGGQLPTADQVGELANKIDGSTIDQATRLINEHKDKLPNKAELQKLIDQIDPATIEKAQNALKQSGLLETLEGQMN